MKKYLHLLVTTVLTGIVSSHAAVITISDFEAPTYTASGDIVGMDGWRWAIGSGTPPGRVTPDTNSGYTFVISGSQSVWIRNGNAVQKSFLSEFITASDIANGELSWLQASPDALPSGASQGLSIMSNTGGANPAGIFGKNVGGTKTIWLEGLTSFDTGIAYVAGGGGAPNLNKIYQFFMTFDFDLHTMTGYYQDITGGGSKTLLGTVGINESLTAATFATNYGVALYSSGGAPGFDNIQLDVVPEPSSMALLALAGGLLSLMGRRQRR